MLISPKWLATTLCLAPVSPSVGVVNSTRRGEGSIDAIDGQTCASQAMLPPLLLDVHLAAVRRENFRFGTAKDSGDANQSQGDPDYRCHRIRVHWYDSAHLSRGALGADRAVWASLPVRNSTTAAKPQHQRQGSNRSLTGQQSIGSRPQKLHGGALGESMCFVRRSTGMLLS
jgi:hypothetical protein